MKYILPDGKKVDCFIETVIERCDNIVMWSEISEPTKKDIKEFKNTPCDHKNQKRQLVYDDLGFIDFRYCAICGCSLGMV